MRDQPNVWKLGNELAPYHPDASHVEPRYRDGWNACFVACSEVVGRLNAQREADHAVIDDALNALSAVSSVDDIDLGEYTNLAGTSLRDVVDAAISKLKARVG